MLQRYNNFLKVQNFQSVFIHKPPLLEPDIKEEEVVRPRKTNAAENIVMKVFSAD